MRVYDIIIVGGVWRKVDDPRSRAHDVALAAGTPFRILEGGAESNRFVAGHVEEGQWLVDEGRLSVDTQARTKRSARSTAAQKTCITDVIPTVPESDS